MQRPSQSAHDPYILTWMLAHPGPRARGEIAAGAVQTGPWTDEQRALPTTTQNATRFDGYLHQAAYLRIWALRDDLRLVKAVERGFYVLTAAGARAAKDSPVAQGGGAQRVGTAFGPARLTPDPREAPRVVFDFDPDARDAQTREHEILVQRLAVAVRKIGREPLLPAGGDPRFDLAFYTEDNETLMVIEVKSLSDEHAVHQLRLGLGQVLHYAHVLGADRAVLPVLAVPSSPPPEWAGVCASAGVQLITGSDLAVTLKTLAAAADGSRGEHARPSEHADP